MRSPQIAHSSIDQALGRAEGGAVWGEEGGGVVGVLLVKRAAVFVIAIQNAPDVPVTMMTARRNGDSARSGRLSCFHQVVSKAAAGGGRGWQSGMVDTTYLARSDRS